MRSFLQPRSEMRRNGSVQPCEQYEHYGLLRPCSYYQHSDTFHNIGNLAISWIFVFFKWPSGKRHRLKCCREFITLLDLDKNGMRVVEFRARCYSYNNFGHVQFRLEKRYLHCHAPSFPPQFALQSHWKRLSYHLKIGIS